MANIEGLNSIDDALRVLNNLTEKVKQKGRAESEKKEIDSIAEAVVKRLIDLKTESEQSNKPEVKQEETPDIKVQSKSIAKSLQAMVEAPSDDPVVQEFQDLNDTLYIASKISRRPATTFVEYQEFFKEKTGLSKNVSKALNQSVAGAGQEWVPTGFSSKFIDLVESARQLKNIHPEVVIPMGVTSLDIGALSTAISMFYYPDTAEDEAEKIPAQTAGTRKVTLTPKVMACRVLMPESYEEDCAYPLASIYRDQLVKAYARAIDNLFINGDTNASPMDYDLTSSYDIRKMFDGYRRATRTVSCRAAVSGSDLTADLRTRLAAMDEYSSPSQCVLVTSYMGFWRLQATSEIITWNQYNGKPLLGNEVGIIPSLGVRVIVSDQYPTNLDASGDGTASGATTSICIVNTNAFIKGMKRELKIVETRDSETARDILVARARLAFVAAYASTEPYVGEVYNIA